jgi:hypothetical protein
LPSRTDRRGIRLVDAATYPGIRRWDAHADGCWSLSFSPDGNTKEDTLAWTPQHAVMHVPREWGFLEFTDDREQSRR